MSLFAIPGSEEGREIQHEAARSVFFQGHSAFGHTPNTGRAVVIGNGEGSSFIFCRSPVFTTTIPTKIEILNALERTDLHLNCLIRRA